jgi:hypothetical protein
VNLLKERLEEEIKKAEENYLKIREHHIAVGTG